MRKNIRYSRGQVILIILLVTVVGLTIGLSLVSRTIQDVKTSSQIAESQKAFSAAEAGIEAALKGAEFGGGSLDLTTGKANYNVTEWGGSSAPFSIPNVTEQDGYSVWLVDHDSNGEIPSSPDSSFTNSSTFDVCFGPETNPIPAVELTLLYRTGSTMKIGKEAYDPNDSRRGDNNFLPADDSGGYCGNTQQKYKAQISLGNFGVIGGDDPILIKVKPVYVDTLDVVFDPTSGPDLPPQGKVISSTGTTTAGVARKINVLQGYSSLPSIFDYTLFTN
ncbi:pilus assembly PilX N-terminal domain-containing protein [Candidatus Roizmanbacteria bacterium]|nr:pilus assembly PilX N-terminal domain-containing protein [Candidatus Roizmanbacteria bacterium]